MSHEYASPHRPPVWPIGSAVGLLLFSGIGLFVSLTLANDAIGARVPTPWYANPWMWIATLTSMTIILMIAVALSAEQLRRRMQTALTVSLTIHFLLAIFLSQQILELIVDEPDATEVAKVPPVPTMPSFYMPTPGQSRTREAFENPLKTDQANGPVSQLSRLSSDQIAPSQSPAKNTQTLTLRPTEITLDRQQKAAPRRADSLSRLSRSELARAESRSSSIRMPRSNRKSPMKSESRKEAVIERRRESAAKLAPSRSKSSREKSQPSAKLTPRQLSKANIQRELAAAASDTSIRRPSSISRRMEANRKTADDVAASLTRSVERPRTIKPTESSPRRERSRQPANAVRRAQKSQSQSIADRLTATPESRNSVAAASRRAERSLETSSLTSRKSASPKNAPVSDARANDIASAPSTLARRATLTPAESGARLQRNSQRGRPAARSANSSSGDANMTSISAAATKDRGRNHSPRSRSEATESRSNDGSFGAPRRRVASASASSTSGPAASIPDSMSESSNTSASGAGLSHAVDASPSTISKSVPNRAARGPGSRSASDSISKSENQGELAAISASGPSSSRGKRVQRSTTDEGSAGENANSERFSTPRRTSLAELSGGGSAASLATSDAANGDFAENASEDGNGSSKSSVSASESMSGESVARSPASIPTRIAARSGTGGLGARKSTTAGIRDRRASSRSESVHEEPHRFLGRRSSKPATLSGRSRRAAEPFARRSARQNGGTIGEGAPDASTEAAIELGLDYLARVQMDDGRWSFQSAGQTNQSEPAIISDTAATGLGLLAFLGAGYDHYEGEYRKNVERALGFLTGRQNSDGDLYVRQGGPSNQGIWLYSHGIAAIALCEAYGMTGDKSLQSAAQSAINFIVGAQHPNYGGWRYAPGVNSDLSVSGWQLMALRSGQLAGLKVPKATITRVHRLLDSTQSKGGQSQYVYNPWSNDRKQAQADRSPNTVMTSVGLLMRLYSGSDRTDAEIQRGAELITQRLPNERQPSPRSMENPNRDAYYWYNATQVMFHMQGDAWNQWRDSLYPLLTDSQESAGELAGSWDPFSPEPDRWAHHAGRIYLTTMNLLSLEVYYRHLPLYGDHSNTN